MLAKKDDKTEKKEESASAEYIENLSNSGYKAGFVSPVAADSFAKGLDESTIRKISEKKSEPQFLLDFRLKSYRYWKKRRYNE